MIEAARKHRVLVVENEANVAVALEYLIAGEGYACSRVANDGAALAVIRETRPDLVLLDAMAPGVSGYAICQEMRLDPRLADVKILLMTAYGSSIERRKGMALGADGFISQPFEVDDLRRQVRALLGAGD